MNKQIKKKKPSLTLTRIKTRVRSLIAFARKGKHKEVHIFTLEREKHFRKKLHNASGFGHMDLKPVYLAFYTWAVSTYGANFIVRPVKMSADNFTVECIIKLRA